jgi:hypothetical protein
MESGSAAIGSAPPPEAGDKKQLHLRFDASMKSPDYTAIFMENGGQLDSMAVRWQTDVSLSGSKEAQTMHLDNNITCKVSIPVDKENYEFLEKNGVSIPSNLRVNLATQRLSAAINGTLVTSLSGEGTAFLYHALMSGAHHQIGMTYKTYEAFSGTFAISNARLVTVDDESGKETRHRPTFKKMTDDQRKMLEAAAAITEQYVKVGYGVRQAVKYEPSPMLHKTVFSEIVGINGRGYTPLHAIMDREMFTSLETLNALYEAAVACDCCQDKTDIQNFLSATDRQGVMAAMEARTVASATSLIVNVLMSYRADGRNVVTPTGAGFAGVENWNNAVPRSCIESNDCDGLALLAVAMIRTAVNMTPEQTQDPRYRYLKAVRNAVFPHYQLALSVIGATAAEANSADASHAQVAGHAITVLVPTVSFLRALSKTTDKTVGADGPLLYAPENRDMVENFRFAALYPSKVVSELPSNEQALLASWSSAKHEFTQLQAYAIEGTTPASPIMYMPNPDRRSKATKDAEKDRKVFSMAAPNVFRSVKVLHVGGSAAGSTHSFYSELVELTFPPDHPLITDGNLRAVNAASPQYVLTPDTEGEAMTRAGVTPQDMVVEEYGAFPLIHLNSAASHALDVAVKLAKMDVMPPRPKKPLQLSDFQTKTLDESMKHLAELEGMLTERTKTAEITDNHHCVAYICAFNTLVHNPVGVKQFVNSLKRVAVSGVVDKRVIPGLAVNTRGEEVGMFLHLDIYAPV